jgi:hypothetical protein
MALRSAAAGILLRCAVVAVAVSIAVLPATAKKRKAPPEIYGYWQANEADKDGFTGLCLGEGGRFASTSFSKKYQEAFVSQGLWRTPGAQELQLLAFPGDGWSAPPLHACKYSLTRTTMALSDCVFAGEWKLQCKQLDRFLECASTQDRPKE